MKKTYRLSLQAEQDLLEIFVFGITRWGQEQAEIYAKILSDCLQLLAKNPEIGIDRSELHNELKSFYVASHVVFYRKRDDCIEIVTILHQHMDVHSKFRI